MEEAEGSLRRRLAGAGRRQSRRGREVKAETLGVAPLCTRCPEAFLQQTRDPQPPPRPPSPSPPPLDVGIAAGESLDPPCRHWRRELEHERPELDDGRAPLDLTRSNGRARRVPVRCSESLTGGPGLSAAFFFPAEAAPAHFTPCTER